MKVVLFSQCPGYTVVLLVCCIFVGLEGFRTLLMIPPTSKNFVNLFCNVFFSFVWLCVSRIYSRVNVFSYFLYCRDSDGVSLFECHCFTFVDWNYLDMSNMTSGIPSCGNFKMICVRAWAPILRQRRPVWHALRNSLQYNFLPTGETRKLMELSLLLRLCVCLSFRISPVKPVDRYAGNLAWSFCHWKLSWLRNF